MYNYLKVLQNLYFAETDVPQNIEPVLQNFCQASYETEQALHMGFQSYIFAFAYLT